MNRFGRTISGAILLALFVGMTAGFAAAQQSGQKPPAPPPAQQPPQQPGQTATPPAPPAAPPENKEEEDAYKAFFEMKGSEPTLIATSGEDFLKKFPESRYRESIYSRLAQAYLNLGEMDKLSVAAEKALEINPQNVDVLSVYGYSILRRFNPNDLDRDQKLQKAETIAKKGIELLNAMARPESIAEEDFTRAKNEKIAMCRSGLGLAYLHQQRFVDAAAELEQATTLAGAPDPTDLYLLGVSYQNAKRYKEASDAYGRCGELEWVWKDRCKNQAANAKKLADQATAPPAAPKP